MIKNFKSGQVRHTPETVNLVKALVEYDRFPAAQREDLNGICGFIADVFTMQDGYLLKIGPEVMTASAVRAVYRKLNFNLVWTVLDKYSKNRHKIKNKTTYLLTSLYNAVIESTPKSDHASCAAYDKSLVDKMLNSDGAIE